MALLEAMERGLTATDVTIDRFFFDWRGGKGAALSRRLEAYRHDSFAAFGMMLGAFPKVATTDHAYWSDRDPCSMHIEEVEAIWSRIAEDDDWSVLDAKVAAIRRMGEAMAERQLLR